MELQKANQTQATLTLSLKDKSLLKIALANKLESQGIQHIAEKLTGEANMMYMKLQQNVNMERILSEPQKSIAVSVKEGNLDALQKMICVSVKYFVDTLQVQHKMGALDFLDFSFLFIERYSHESVEDLILALKYAKIEGRKFYNAFGTQDLFEIFAEYQERKAHERENQHLKVKASSEKSNLLELINNTNNPEMKNYVDLIKQEKPRPKPVIKTRNLDDEINELKSYFLQHDVSLSDCIKFKESCFMRGLKEQYDMICEVIEIKENSL